MGIGQSYTSTYTTDPASRNSGIIKRAGGVSPDGFQPVRCGDFMLLSRTRISCARTK